MWCLALVGGVASAEAATDESAAAATTEPVASAPVLRHDFVYPRAHTVDGYALVVHAPQIESWPGFETFAALMAVELTPPDGTPVRYATATIQGKTEVDLAAQVVRVVDPAVTNVKFAGDLAPAAYAEAVRQALREGVLEIPLALFVGQVADAVLADPPPAGFNVDPPAIVVRSKPTLLLFINGEPVGSAIPGTGLELLVNANWPLLRE